MEIEFNEGFGADQTSGGNKISFEEEKQRLRKEIEEGIKKISESSAQDKDGTVQTDTDKNEGSGEVLGLIL